MTIYNIFIPFNVTSTGILGTLDILVQTTLFTPKEHCVMLSVTEMEHATEVVVVAVVLMQLPQFDVML